MGHVVVVAGLAVPAGPVGDGLNDGTPRGGAGLVGAAVVGAVGGLLSAVGRLVVAAGVVVVVAVVVVVLSLAAGAGRVVCGRRHCCCVEGGLMVFLRMSESESSRLEGVLGWYL